MLPLMAEAGMRPMPAEGLRRAWNEYSGDSPACLAHERILWTLASPPSSLREALLELWREVYRPVRESLRRLHGRVIAGDPHWHEARADCWISVRQTIDSCSWWRRAQRQLLSWLPEIALAGCLECACQRGELAGEADEAHHVAGLAADDPGLCALHLLPPALLAVTSSPLVRSALALGGRAAVGASLPPGPALLPDLSRLAEVALALPGRLSLSLRIAGNGGWRLLGAVSSEARRPLSALLALRARRLGLMVSGGVCLLCGQEAVSDERGRHHCPACRSGNLSIATDR